MAKEIQAISTSSFSRGLRRWGFADDARVFGEWCLRRETPILPPRMNQMILVLPVALSWWFSFISWSNLRYPGAGVVAVRQLIWLAALAIVGGGVTLATRVICWEASAESRDIVRMTGLEARHLLWLKSLACWWSIGWSVLMLTPLLLFAFTLGGVPAEQLFSGLCGLVLLAVLVGSFAMLASVLAIDSKNPERTAATTTWIGLFLYNLSFVLLGMVITFLDKERHGYRTPEGIQLANQIVECSPFTILQRALSQHILFEPTAPGYWLHFLTATVCVVVASWIIEVRFHRSPVDKAAIATHKRELRHTLVGRNTGTDAKPQADAEIAESDRTVQLAADLARPETSNTSSSAAVAPRKIVISSSERPRCLDRPFFWKDLYVLGDEGKWVNMWTLFHLVCTMGVVGVSVVAWDVSERYWIAFAAFALIALTTIIVAMRFDSLLTAEFRDQTWGSLMLLPVDPVDLLKTKLAATLYEQRYAGLSTGLAMLALMARGPDSVSIAAIMAVVIAMLVGSLLCQISCINQFLGKAWWLGPVQIMGFIAALVPTIMIWIKLGPTPGFFVVVVLMSVLILVVQFNLVSPLARNWVESS